MKYTFLLFGLMSLYFSIYFFIERRDIFKEVIRSGFFQTDISELNKPTFLLLFSVFFFLVYYKQFKKPTIKKKGHEN